jgi:hypothetical protein
MNFTPSYSLIFCCIFSLVLFACSDNSKADVQENNTSLAEENTVHPYPAFLNFPEKQFKSIYLGETCDQLENEIAKLPVEVIAEEEDNYFYFPADSTELIVPNTIVLNEFKVFLRSRNYLDNYSEFDRFLADLATDEAVDDTFTVYYYETAKADFKLTLFSQPNSIRIHFLMTKLHS